MNLTDEPQIINGALWQVTFSISKMVKIDG